MTKGVWGAVPALSWGFEEGDNLGLGEGEIKLVDLAPGLGELHEG